MICLIALVVFGVLGLFSAKYRDFAREAFSCVTLRMTLRKCNSRFDEQMKAKITARLIAVSPQLAKFVRDYFEAISWFFTILMLASMVLAAQGVYNYWAYGNCNGPNSSAFCIFSAVAGGSALSPPVSLDGPRISNGTGDTLVVFGCFSCPYSRAAWGGLRHYALLRKDNLTVVFKPLALPGHNNSVGASAASLCAERQGRFVEFADAAFANQSLLIRYGDSALEKFAAEAGLDLGAYRACYYGNQTGSLADVFQEEGVKSGVYGTPTFFYDNRSAVGPLSLGNFEAFAAGSPFTPDASIDSGFCAQPAA